MQIDPRTDDAPTSGVGRRLVIGLLVIAVAATALVLTLTSRGGRVSAQVVGYSVSADGRLLSLRIQHGTADCDDDVQVAVNESAERVTLYASAQSRAQACNAAARITPFAVTLQNPLADRTVVDGTYSNSPVPSS
ncbi:MAG: hypothetical protein B7X41_12585 [Microbacterium sp. 14-71-5]|nr:MAG: hypothetical protein B7X41_12585 [Microbacterium sp. 14-71-5]